ncbi:MAG: RNA 2',3'-cyclic phosphodiesterase [Calditrichaceae bacterium]
MTDLIRSFIAIELPPELKSQIDVYLKALRGIAPNVNWVRSESMHLTLKFLGNLQPDMVNRVVLSLMDTGKSFPPFSLKITNFGSFPNRRTPRIIWLGLTGVPQESLLSLHQWIDNRMSMLGFEREQRAFSPHLTLGRLKEKPDPVAIWEYLDHNPFNIFDFRVTEFVLMRSNLKPTGAEYRPLQKYTLQE